MRRLRYLCESFNSWFLELDTVYVCADRFVNEELQYVAIHVLGCSVRSGYPFNGYQDMGMLCCIGVPWTGLIRGIALNRTAVAQRHDGGATNLHGRLPSGMRIVPRR